MTIYLAWLSIVILFAVFALLVIDLRRVVAALAEHKRVEADNSVLMLGGLLLFIIIACPFLFTGSYFKAAFSSTGPIGDTIGGLTAPFINAIGAILVYVAFRQQVAANKELAELTILGVISSDLEWVRNDKYEILKLVQTASDNITVNGGMEIQTRRATVILVEMQNIVELAKLNKTLGVHLIRRLGVLYRLYYAREMQTLQSLILNAQALGRQPCADITMADFFLELTKVEKLIG